MIKQVTFGLLLAFALQASAMAQKPQVTAGPARISGQQTARIRTQSQPAVRSGQTRFAGQGQITANNLRPRINNMVDHKTKPGINRGPTMNNRRPVTNNGTVAAAINRVPAMNNRRPVTSYTNGTSSSVQTPKMNDRRPVTSYTNVNGTSVQGPKMNDRRPVMNNGTVTSANDDRRPTISDRRPVTNNGGLTTGIDQTPKFNNRLPAINNAGDQGTPVTAYDNGQSSNHMPRLSDGGQSTSSSTVRPQTGVANRLAAIDRLRDRALETGNVSLLKRADGLEKTARQQFGQNGHNQRPTMNNNQFQPPQSIRPESSQGISFSFKSMAQDN